MKVRRPLACGAMLLLLALLAAGVAVLAIPQALAYLPQPIQTFIRPKSGSPPKADPSYALITAPLSQAIVFSGDPVHVTVSAVLAHRNLGGVALLVDGQKYVLDQKLQSYAPKIAPTCPFNDLTYCGALDYNLLWMAGSAGPHDLSACVYGDEQPAPAWSVCTEPVRVAVVDGKAAPASSGNYAAQSEDTLASVSQKFNLPEPLVGLANPNLDPRKPLPSGTQVKIPNDPSVPAPPSGSVSTTGPWTVSQVKMSTDLGIDKGYCYYMFGTNAWSRVPAGPQTFAYPVDGTLDLSSDFQSMPIPADGGSLSLECWGWSGSTLVSLGAGQTNLTPGSSAAVKIQGDHFQLNASLVGLPGNLPPRDLVHVIPPPTGVTGVGDAETCIKHMPAWNFFLHWFCKAAAEKSDTILVWDWSVPSSKPPKGSVWVDKIDGYHVYMVPHGGKPKLIMTVTPDPTQTAFDMSFLHTSMVFILGQPSFFVRAYVGPLESANSNVYTLGSVSPGLKEVILYPTVARYGGQKRYIGSGFCGTKLIVGSPDIAGDEVAVGYDHAEPPDTCYDDLWEYSRAFIGFDLKSVKGVVVSSAVLSYRMGYTSAKGKSCASILGTVSASDASIHVEDVPPYTLEDVLGTAGWPGTPFYENVTDVVQAWVSGKPITGFLFMGMDESLPEACGGLLTGCIGTGSISCWTTYRDFRLDILYFATP